jgi:hypothetical protein
VRSAAALGLAAPMLLIMVVPAARLAGSRARMRRSKSEL